MLRPRTRRRAQLSIVDDQQVCPSTADLLPAEVTIRECID
jgi:hypothetical protein